MDDASTYRVAAGVRWAGRISTFSVCLLLVAILLHRFNGLSTPVALNAFAVSFAGALAALLFAGWAMVRIWRKGEGGALRATMAIVISLCMLAWPIGYLSLHWRLPQISDVTTDTASPPRFNALASRPKGANPSTYGGDRVAQAQLQAYPDLHTFVLERPVEEAFELVEEAARKLRWKVAATEAPVARPAKPGILEATDQTTLIGFWDDIVVRVEGSSNRARVDVRSASRYGQFDFGQNATRVRRFLVELQARVDASSPNAIAGRRSLRTTRAGAALKKGKASDPPKTGAPSGADRAPPNAQRVRVPKETQR